MQQLKIETLVFDGMKNLVGESQANKAMNQLANWSFTVNHRATGRLGCCFFKKQLIEVSDVLLKMEHRNKLQSTVLHEIAHAVDMLLHGRSSGHGYNWQRIMLAFNQTPHRCNQDADVTADMLQKRAAKAKWIYACERCEHEFSAMRRKKHHPSSYFHKGCGGKLYLKMDKDGNVFYNPSKRAA